MANTYLAVTTDPLAKLPPRGAYRTLRLSSEASSAYDPDSGKFMPDAVGVLIGEFLDETSARRHFVEAATDPELGELVLVSNQGRVLAHRAPVVE